MSVVFSTHQETVVTRPIKPRSGQNTRKSFYDKVERALSEIRYEIARTSEQFEAIYKLRYEANLREQAIEPNDSRRLADKFDEVDNVINIGVFVEDVLLSALRLHVVDKQHPYSPAFEVYNDLLAHRVERGEIIVDGNRFVANYPLARSYPQLPYITLRPGILAAEYFGAQNIVASVRSEHFAFYKREYFAEKLCEPRPYPTLVKPLSLIRIDYVHDRDQIIGRHPFYDSPCAERNALFEGALPFA